MNVVDHRLLRPEDLQGRRKWNQLDVMEVVYVGILGQRGLKRRSIRWTLPAFSIRSFQLDI